MFTLIQSGFTQQQILYEMPAHQVMAFYEVALSNRKRELQDLCYINVLAARGNEKDLESFLKG